MNRTYILLIVFFFLASCEGYRYSVGVVKDKQTLQPLDSVFVDVLTGKQEMYTDSSGKFDVQNQMGGCIGGCPDIEVKFSKPGYKSVILKNAEDTEVLMERE